jgi:hypothetical protein
MEAHIKVSIRSHINKWGGKLILSSLLVHGLQLCGLISIEVHPIVDSGGPQESGDWNYKLHQIP